MSFKCVFCSIVKENKPHHEIIWENKTHMAFLDINPTKDGHTLIIPKKHTDFIFELNEKEYLTLLKASRAVALRIKERLKAKCVYMFVKGRQVRHVHIHLIPIHKDNEAGSLPRGEKAPGKLAKTATKLR